MSASFVNVLHVPHASRVIPDDVRAKLLLSDEELTRELDRMTDHATDRLFDADPTTCHVIEHPVSRLVVDPERFVDDAREPMAEHGMGVIYTATSDGRRLREDPTPEERASLLERFYVPHHERFTRAVDAALEAHDRCLIIDAHSFPDDPLPYERWTDRSRPMICIGSDPFHTPEWLFEILLDVFVGSGFSPVGFNDPFKGAIVPAKHYLQDARVHALMVEVNRAVYWDEERRRPGPAFEAVRQALRRALTLVRGKTALRFMP